MTDRDEPSKAQKPRKSRRRSLRVPVDEVPRPTASADGGSLDSSDGEDLEDSFEVALDGSSTMEMPAFVEEGRSTLETVRRREDTLEEYGDDSELSDDSGDDAALMGAPRDDVDSTPLDEAPTTVREAPSEQQEAQARGTEPDTDDGPRVSVDEGASVEVDLGDDLDDDLEGGLERDVGGHMEARRGPKVREPERSARMRRSAADDDNEFDESSTIVEAQPETPEKAEPEKPVEPAVRVVVQRVVSVVSAPGSRSPSPPEPEAAPAAYDAPTAPGTELAVDVDEMEEPDVTLADDAFASDAGGAEASEERDLEELDVDLDEQPPPPPGQRDSTPELSEQDLLEEEEAAAAAKRPSKPPPPPANPSASGPVAMRAHAPPPPPSEPRPAAEARPVERQPEAAKAAAKPAASAPKPKKARRKWWESLFNDDYLRTVPIPHPKTILKQCDFIEERLGLAPGATILDVGCGLGSHAVELTKRGFLVVGLDLSLPMLSRAADEAQDHGLKINFLHADMREMNFDGAFDAVLCWGTTFGYFDDDTNKLVIDRLYKALKPRGHLLLDVVNRDYVIHGQPNLVWFEGDASVVMEETQMNYITSRLEVKRTVILDDGRQRDNLYSLRLYSLHELGQILHLQGFRVVEVTGREAHPGVFFGADSPKLIILAERRPQQAAPPTPRGRSVSGEIAAASEPPHEGLLDASHPSPTGEAPVEETIADEAMGAEPVAPEPGDEPSDAVAAALAETLEQSSEELERSGEAVLPDDDGPEDLAEEEIGAGDLADDDTE
jgi:SAM-dependent methyltransferase